MALAPRLRPGRRRQCDQSERQDNGGRTRTGLGPAKGTERRCQSEHEFLQPQCAATLAQNRTFTPNRTTRGGTNSVTRLKAVPESEFTRVTVLALVTLKTSSASDVFRRAIGRS